MDGQSRKDAPASNEATIVLALPLSRLRTACHNLCTAMCHCPGALDPRACARIRSAGTSTQDAAQRSDFFEPRLLSPCLAGIGVYRAPVAEQSGAAFQLRLPVAPTATPDRPLSAQPVDNPLTPAPLSLLMATLPGLARIPSQARIQGVVRPKTARPPEPLSATKCWSDFS